MLTPIEKTCSKGVKPGTVRNLNYIYIASEMRQQDKAGDPNSTRPEPATEKKSPKCGGWGSRGEDETSADTRGGEGEDVHCNEPKLAQKRRC